MSTDEDQIRNLLAEREAAYVAKDATGMLAGSARDLVEFSLAPPLATRPGDLSDIGEGQAVDMSTVEGVQAWLDKFGDVAFAAETRDLVVEVGGDVAFAHSLSRMGTDQFDLWYRTTVGLRKTSGTWQVTHVHQSVPFYMDEAMRAATDLTP